MAADRAAIGSWEQFYETNQESAIHFDAIVNNSHVTAESAGRQPLIANRGTIGTWEKFKVIDDPNGNQSLLAAANGKYVTAESAGAKPLIASRTAAGLWEEFIGFQW